MARIRTIKPEFFTSDDICGLTLAARLLYIGTWCEADREGRLEWKPRSFKRRYLPDDDVDIDALCAELIDAGLVVLYGNDLAVIPTFGKHQHVNPREAASILPENDASSTRHPRVTHASPRDSDAQVGREGKGRKGKEHASTTRIKKTPLAESFAISDRVKAWASEKGHSRLSEHLDAFKAKAKANGYTYADWDAAFMEAIRNDWAKLGNPPSSTAVNGQSVAASRPMA